MGKFFAELKRRNIYRVAAAYAVVAWLLLQLVNNVAPVLDLPFWVARAFLLLLAIGFPVALFFAWIRELAPADGVTAQTGSTKLDYVLAGSLIAVIVLVSYEQMARTPDGRTAETTQAAVAPAVSQSSPNRAGISIAVLPFTNLSGDASQEFFSDGMTEEITSALTRVPDLHVVARTSAFQFKGRSSDIAAIGQALKAGYLIEGSVRKDGNRVRITAQLVQADNGVNVWTESYDRQLTGVFAIQEEIAEAIARALRVPLGLRQGEALVASRTNDLESYQQYLRARALYRARSVSDAIAILEPLVARDPNYAPAWGLLAEAYALAPAYEARLTGPSLEEVRRVRQSSLDKREMVAREAIRLDPRHAGGYAALAYLQGYSKNWAARDDLYRQAFALDPDDPDALELYGLSLATVGHLKQALSSRERLRTLEPFVPIYNIITAEIMQINGQNPASVAILEAVPRDDATDYLRNTILAMAYAEAGRYAEGADTLLTIRSSRYSRQSVETAARLLRSAPARVVSALDALPVLEGALQFVYAHVGAPDRVLEGWERNLEEGGGMIVAIWHPQFAPLRKTERFKALVRANGLVDYWRARGWPDLCRPQGAGDFTCD